MVSGDLIREARLRAGLTQSLLAIRLGRAQSEIARWERGEVLPSLERLREIVRGCDLELTFSLSQFDDSNFTVIDEHLRMTTAQRLDDLLERVAFQARQEQRRGSTRG